MTEEVLYELTKLYVEEIDKKQEKFIITKEGLVGFAIKLVKLIKKVEESSSGT